MPKLKSARKRTKLGKDRRRKHKHWQVTIFYRDGERFARVYTDRAKAAKFAERQRKSPVVKTARVLQVGGPPGAARHGFPTESRLSPAFLFASPSLFSYPDGNLSPQGC